MDFIQYSTNNRLAIIVLNRPDKRNALNSIMASELFETFKKAELDNNVKIVVLKANGDAFCAGADLAYLKDLNTFSYEENLEDSMNLKEMFRQIYKMKKIVIAQIEGHAIAGGAGLATVCDLVFSVPDAKFGFTEVKIGFVPAIVSIFAIRKFGESHTKNLLFSGDLISAAKAQDIGLVNFISDKEKIDSEVQKFANHLLNNTSANSLALTKNLINKIQDMDLEAALDYAARLNALARGSDDCKKGIGAFLNKEKIVW